MSGSAVHAPRLATGDWVVQARPDGGVPGLGKVVDGEWDPRDDALLRVRLETAARAVWLAAGEVERLSPADEADLVARAVESQVVAEPRATELRARVAAFRRGALPFVRSPGLLDRLWSALTHSEPRPLGLTAFFDHGRVHLEALRGARLARGNDEPETRAEVVGPAGDLRRALCKAEALDRIIEWLPVDPLAALCDLWGHPYLHVQPRPVVRAVLLASGLTLRPLLEWLPRPLLLEVPAMVGLPRLDWADGTIVSAVLGQLDPLPPLEPWESWRRRRRASRRRVPATEAEATRRVVKCVRSSYLPALCEALGDPGLLRPGRGPTARAIAAADPGLPRLFAALPLDGLGTLRRLPPALGLDDDDLRVTLASLLIDDDDDGDPRAALAGLLARLQAALALVPVLERVVGAVPDGARATFVRDLGVVCRPDESGRDVAAALATTLSLDDVLDALTPSELRRAGRACDLDGDGDELRAALGDLARPP